MQSLTFERRTDTDWIMSQFLVATCFFLILSSVYSSQSLNRDVNNFNFIDDVSFKEITDPDHFRNVPQLISSRGFDYEEHFVTTEDGYILRIHRIVHPYLRENEVAGDDVKRPPIDNKGPEKIPAKDNFKNLKKRGVVLLQHGLMSSSHDFIINDLSGFINEPVEEDDSYLEELDSSMVRNCLGFELAKRGYDVWMSNSRGNVYSRNHTTLNPDTNKTYWDFTYDEMIKYDLPATIDFVREVTGSDKIGYVGHSQGSLLGFGLLATRPEYTKILSPLIAMAPVATLASVGTPLRHLAKIPFLTTLLRRLTPEFASQGWFTKFIADRLCSSRFAVICSNIMFATNGYSTEQLDMNRVGVYANHYPAGTSSKNILHYAQAVNHGRFQMYDYGKNKNYDIYGCAYAQEYPLDKIDGSNIILIHSDNDLLATPRDVATLVGKLGGEDKIYDRHLIPHPHWNHLDFVIAKEAGAFVNFKILKYLKEFEI